MNILSIRQLTPGMFEEGGDQNGVGGSRCKALIGIWLSIVLPLQASPVSSTPPPP